MKKTLLFTISLILTSFAFAKDFGTTEISIYNEVTAAFETGFYPGAVEKTNQLQADFPDSVFILPALIQKGEALIYLNRYDEAVQTLETALSKLRPESTDFPRVYFLLGKANFQNSQNSVAIEYFHKSCVSSLELNVKDYYSASILYSAKIFYMQELYEKANSLFEYVITHGTEYSKSEYEEALQKLCVSYNNSLNALKTVSLVQKYSQESLTENTYWVIQLTMAESYELLDDYISAYALYTKITENAPASFGVISLKKAYVIANTKFDRVDGENFEKSISAIATNPQLEQEFWIRLGVDEYNQKNPEKALEYFENAGPNGVAILYKNKIALDSQKNPQDVEKNLVENQSTILESPFENISDSYYSVLLAALTMQKKWEEIPAVYEKIDIPSCGDKYNYASSLYAQKKYADAVAYFDGFGEPDTPSAENAQLLELNASCLAQNGKAARANSIYKTLYENALLSTQSKLEYSKTLFTTGSYKSSLALALETEIPEGLYISGLCCINLKRWETARNYFVSYIKTQSNKPDFNKMALFYKGYAEYCLELYKDSYASFVRFGMEGGNNKYVRNAYEYAAKSALQLGEYKNAALQAENVVKASATAEEKQDAVLFSAQINSDYGNYAQAISILAPYTKISGEFAERALFQTAKIYEKQGSLADADNIYTKIYTNYAGTDLAEEAMYRSGEIFYSAEDYANAQIRLNKYIYKYVSGRFTESALFYCGDSFLHLGEMEKSIMMNKTLVQKYPSSIYLYGAYKNLVTAYYESAEYSSSLEAAKFLVKNFDTQAAADGIGTKLKEIEKIVSGTDRRIVETYSEYEKLGKGTTVQGRHTGTKLVLLYAENDETKKEAYSLATELLRLQKGDPDKYDAAQNAEYIADCDRANNENKKAAEMYLLAAEYYRSSQNGDSKAAAALYGAVEAFVAQGMAADAKETANLLVKLYPESKQAKNVRRLVGNL